MDRALKIPRPNVKNVDKTLNDPFNVVLVYLHNLIKIWETRQLLIAWLMMKIGAEGIL